MANALHLTNVSVVAEDVVNELNRIQRTGSTAESLDMAGQLLAAAVAFVTNEDSASRAIFVLTGQLDFLREVDALQRAEAAERAVH